MGKLLLVFTVLSFSIFASEPDLKAECEKQNDSSRSEKQTVSSEREVVKEESSSTKSN